MFEIPVKLKARSYSINVGAGLLTQVGRMLRDGVGDRARTAVVVSNRKVDALYGGRLRRSLRSAGFSVRTFLMGDGERFKTLKTAEALYSFLIEHRVERGDVLVALGGGVTGDLAGFVAATYLRGIGIVQVPTTLLAQIDSSAGGKTGVNHRRGKNLIGAFHQPLVVVADTDTLKSLPRRELRSGLFEAIKYGVIRDRDLFVRISANASKLLAVDPLEIEHLVARSCEIKAEVVSRDERESGPRRILNFGHTAGHAIEAVTGYRRFLHGEAVALGMRVASRIAELISLLSAGERQLIDDAIRRFGPIPSTGTLAVGDIISSIRYDKKAESGRVNFVLPARIGRVVIRPDVPPRVVKQALTDVLS